MKLKLRGKNGCPHEWCEKHYGFYRKLIKKSCPCASTDFLIKRYYKEQGVLLDRDFVVGMLKSLPENCAKILPNGHWELSLTPIWMYAKTKTTLKQN